MLKLLIHSKNRNFFRLWLAQLVSQFGDRVHQFALIGLIAERSPGSAMDLAILLAFTIIPVFIFQPIAGVIVDRFNRRTTLFICDLARGCLVLLIPFFFLGQSSMAPIYVIVFLVFCFSRFYVPAKMSIIPDLVPEDNLLKANSLVTTTGMIAAGLGGVFGAFIIEWYGAKNGFIIDALTYFVSSVFIFNMNIPWKMRIDKKQILEKGKEIVAIEKSIWLELKEGFRYLASHKEIRFVINTGFVLFGTAGAVYVTSIVFIQEAFGSVTRDLGILAVCLVVGLFFGCLTYGKWGKEVAWHKTICMCLFSGGIVLIFFSLFVHFYPNMILVMAIAFLLGLMIGPIFVAANTIVHIVSDENMRGKVFSALEIAIHLAFLVTMFISSWAYSIIQPVWILSAVGVLCIGFGIVGQFHKSNVPAK